MLFFLENSFMVSGIMLYYENSVIIFIHDMVHLYGVVMTKTDFLVIGSGIAGLSYAL